MIKARAFWAGVLTFGLVTVPVGLCTATEGHTVGVPEGVRAAARRSPALAEGRHRHLHHAHWNPDEFHDTSEERVQALVDAKREGQEIVGEAGPPEATNVIGLMEALQSSVERARSKDNGKRDRPAGERRGLPSRRDDKDGAGKRRGTKGGGGENELERLTKKELYEFASDRGIAGRSKMSRDQLVKALKDEATAA